jgi:heme-degrading monooxygenase HmoA
MDETITTGTWVVASDKAASFVDAWAAFAEWSRKQDGADTLRLGHDLTEPNRYVSFASWDSLEAVHAWKANPEMRERLGQVMKHVDDFHSEELGVVVRAEL